MPQVHRDAWHSGDDPVGRTAAEELVAFETNEPHRDLTHKAPAWQAPLTWCWPGPGRCPSAPRRQGAWAVVWKSARPGGLPGWKRRLRLRPASLKPRTFQPRGPAPGPRRWSKRKRPVSRASSFLFVATLLHKCNRRLLVCGVHAETQAAREVRLLLPWPERRPAHQEGRTPRVQVWSCGPGATKLMDVSLSHRCFSRSSSLPLPLSKIN